MFFYRIGEYFMDLATDQSREQIMEAVDLRPQMVNLISSENNVTEIPAEDAKVGDYLLIRPGDRIPLDGIVVKETPRLIRLPLPGNLFQSRFMWEIHWIQAA